MDLQLGLSLNSCSFDSDDDDLFSSSFPVISHNKKRSFTNLREEHDDDDDDVLLPTLPLLPLTPSHEADLDNDLRTSSSIVTKHDGDDGGESAAVGWPPLMSQRKKLRCEEDGGMAGIIRHYVKVKMEGDGIGRKVDLSLHHSFQKLKETLIAMFGKCNHHSDCYELAYQDREGDWLLAEDLPWKNFVECAQRLKLVKRTS